MATYDSTYDNSPITRVALTDSTGQPIASGSGGLDQEVVGNVAAAATDSGNPVKTGGKYNSSAPTYTNGQRGDTQIDASGNTKIVEQFAPTFEDNTAGVAKVEHRYTAVKVAADTAVKGSAGFLHALTFSCNDAAPTAGSIIVYDNTAESGTELFNVSFTTTWFPPCTVIIDGTFANGLYVGFTTTADVNVTVSYR